MNFSTALFLGYFSPPDETPLKVIPPIGGSIPLRSAHPPVLRVRSHLIRKPLQIIGPQGNPDDLTADILLISDSATYRASAAPHRFSLLLSAYTIADGTYNVVLQKKRNDGRRELLKTEYFLKCTNAKWELYAGRPTHPPENPTYSREIVYHLDTVKIVGHSAHLSGWVYHDKIPSHNQQVYINFFDARGEAQTYLTATVWRRDIPETQRGGSGFEVTVPRKVFKRYNKHITIILENGGLYETGTVDMPSEES